MTISVLRVLLGAGGQGGKGEGIGMRDVHTVHNELRESLEKQTQHHPEAKRYRYGSPGQKEEGRLMRLRDGYDAPPWAACAETGAEASDTFLS
jgi:hypothetical protein